MRDRSIVGADDAAPSTVTITVRDNGQPDREIIVPYGANLRDELIARKINVYQSLTRWTDCNGKQLCGTCIVNVAQGVEACTRRSLDEASTLRENPKTYKLACITNVYGDVTVELMLKVNAAHGQDDDVGVGRVGRAVRAPRALLGIKARLARRRCLAVGIRGAAWRSEATSHCL